MNERTKREAGMDIETFDRCVSAYGADPERWPEDRRDSMEALLRESAQAQELVAREAALDALLEEVPAIEPSELMRARVIAAAKAARASRTERLNRWVEGAWTLRRAWGPLGALAAAAMLGLVVGTLAPQPTETASVDDAEAIELALDELVGIGDTP